jgi:hypothetical protein
MSLFDEDVKPRNGGKSPQSGNNCDIFEPSVYTPEESKYRADYIKRITARITAELDGILATEEPPDGELPVFDLVVTGKDPEKHLKFTAKYLRGPRGFRGSLENFVVLSEGEYERLKVKDPNVFYFTYEGEDTPGYVEDNVLITMNDVIEDNVLITSGTIEDNILTI